MISITFFWIGVAEVILATLLLYLVPGEDYLRGVLAGSGFTIIGAHLGQVHARIEAINRIKKKY